jgi:hypothetical protein
MRKLLIAAATLAALAIPASAPAEASHRDGWGVSATVHFGSHDRWRDDRRWRGHSRWRGGWRDDDWRWRGRGWRGHPGRHLGWRNSCRRWWFDGWGWRCVRWR